MGTFFKNMIQKSHLTKRALACLAAVIMMGFTLSFLVRIDWGTDPCTAMNLGISHTIGLSFGNWQAFFNLALFILVVAFGKEQIGFGTLFNMFLVGYSCDFFSWLWNRILPAHCLDTFGIKLLMMIVMLTLFVIVASIYMTVDLGMSPYDALPKIIYEKQKKLSFRIVRIAWDVSAALIGLAFGATLGIVTVIMAFALGPVIAMIQPYVESFFEDKPIQREEAVIK